jgi:cobalt-zinc-cadmium efflux system membrane fusion protein
MKNTLLIYTVVFILSACSSEKIQEKEFPQNTMESMLTLSDAQYKNAGIRLGKLENRDISTILKLNGKIDVPPQNMVSVSTPFGGFLKSTRLLPGMRIKKGEIIASMEDQQYIQLQQDYLSAKSKLKFIEGEYNRQKELNQSKASSDKIFQQMEMEFTTQKITLSALSEKLKLINIQPETLNESSLSRGINLYSSIDGFVSKVNVNIGKYVNPSDVLFELINPEDIHLNLKVFEKDLTKLFIGQTLLAFNNNQPDKKYPCEIILISQDLSADRSADVHCHFDDYDKTLLPGMYMNAEVEIKMKNVSSIQEDAIVNYEGKDFVFISRGNLQFEMVEVKKGSSENNFTEISPLSGTDFSKSRFVVKGAYSLLMQLKNKSE